MTLHKRLSVVLVVFCTLLTSSCTYSVNGANTRFSSVNVLTLKVGMSQEEVIKMFGPPTRVRNGTCGGATKGGEWDCTTWEYDVEVSDSDLTKTNILVFNSSVTPMLLNNWTINRMW